jgi:hypothetical protein
MERDSVPFRLGRLLSVFMYTNSLLTIARVVYIGVFKSHLLTVVCQSNVIARGPDKVAIYNEGFAETAGDAHPFLMGHTFRETVSDSKL